MENLLTLAELEQYYREKSPAEIIYCTDDQDWYKSALNENIFSTVTLTFTSMLICMFPNLIFLKSENSSMQIGSVRSVTICTDNEREDVITIHCRRRIGEPQEKRYTLIMRWL